MPMVAVPFAPRRTAGADVRKILCSVPASRRAPAALEKDLCCRLQSSGHVPERITLRPQPGQAIQ